MAKKSFTKIMAEYEDYKSPHDLLADKTLTKDEKIKILSQWASDEQNRLVATEENMLAGTNERENLLPQIQSALETLDVNYSHTNRKILVK